MSHWFYLFLSLARWISAIVPICAHELEHLTDLSSKALGKGFGQLFFIEFHAHLFELDLLTHNPAP